MSILICSSVASVPAVHAGTMVIMASVASTVVDAFSSRWSRPFPMSHYCCVLPLPRGCGVGTLLATRASCHYHRFLHLYPHHYPHHCRRAASVAVAPQLVWSFRHCHCRVFLSLPRLALCGIPCALLHSTTVTGFGTFLSTKAACLLLVDDQLSHPIDGFFHRIHPSYPHGGVTSSVTEDSPVSTVHMDDVS